MLNKKILFFLQLLLFIKVNSTLSEDLDTEIMEKQLSKCLIPFFSEDEIDADKCSAISPSEGLDEIYKARCCKITISTDSLYNYKKYYNEDWKNIIINEYDLNEDITEEEIRNKYLPSRTQEMCFPILDSMEKSMFYQMSLLDVNGEVKYDCGTGEKSFTAKSYHPTDKDELIDKDYIDCKSEYTEKNCNKRSTKLSSDDSQCCWCEKLGLGEEEENLKECNSFRISRMKELLQKSLKYDKSEGGKYEYKCDCYNRKGNNIKASYNTITGDIKIE